MRHEIRGGDPRRKRQRQREDPRIPVPRERNTRVTEKRDATDERAEH